MNKRGILVSVVILLGAAGFVHGQEGELHGTIDVTYLSKYLWRGFDWYGEHGAIQPSIDLDLYGTGFGLKALYTVPFGSGNNDAFGFPNHELKRLDFTLYYHNTLFEGEPYSTNYKVGWMYYNHVETSTSNRDLQECFASLSWPNICPWGIVPHYTVVAMWPAKGGSQLNRDLSTLGRGDMSGWLHIFGLGYDWSVPGLMPDTPEQALHLSADFVYNDGVLGADHELSHAVLGISTEFDLGNDVAFVPGVYYQASMEDSVNTEDEAWVALSVRYKF